jgi:predicted permease
MRAKFSAWMQHCWLRFLTLFRHQEASQRFDDEMQFHIEQQIAENLAAGMNPAAAREAALRLFGNRSSIQERTHDTWGWLRLEELARSVRYAARSLRRTAGFSAVSILVIALGIGATTALFTIVRSVVLNPLPFRDPGRLVRLYERSSDERFSHNSSAGGVFAEWRKQDRDFADLALVMQEKVAYSLSGDGGELPEEVPAAMCSWNFFPMLGVEPALGRGFRASDDDLSANATAILTWGLWKRRFGGDPAILNRTIHLEQKSYTVIGILPASFSYPDQQVQLWTPVYHEIDADEMNAIDSHDFVAIGRLKPGVSEGEATAELSVITRRLHDAHLDDPFVSIGAESRPLLDDVVGDVKTPLYVLLAATGCVLLITCLNVASLLVARGAARRRDLAIRTALGGSRSRLIGEHLTESFLLSAIGGGAGLLMAYAVIQWFVSTRQDVSRVETVHMDAATFGGAAILVFLCAIFVGSTSLHSLKGDQILASLQESSRSNTAGRARVRLRKWLLSLEVGLTVVLLIVAGLLLESYQHLRAANLGCATDNVLTLGLSLPDWKYSQTSQAVNFYNALLERARALPGVQAAGLVRTVPGARYGGDGGFVISEHPPLPANQMQNAMTRWADRGYFAAMGIPMLRGNTFDANLTPGHAQQMVVTELFVRKYFANEDPIGKHVVAMGGQSFQIVGVVGDTRFAVAQEPRPMMYVPLAAGAFDSATLVVRSRMEVTSLALPIQRVVQELDPGLAVFDILTMDQIIGGSTRNASFDATLLLAFAVLSLVLAAVGLFGVLSYVVAQRTTEIGIRMALGAQRGDVLRLTLLDGLKPAGAGLLVGLAAAAAAVKLIRNLLYGVEPLDARVFAGVALILLVVAGVACLVPAWRASRLDPLQALRNE